MPQNHHSIVAPIKVIEYYESFKDAIKNADYLLAQKCLEQMKGYQGGEKLARELAEEFKGQFSINIQDEEQNEILNKNDEDIEERAQKILIYTDAFETFLHDKKYDLAAEEIQKVSDLGDQYLANSLKEQLQKACSSEEERQEKLLKEQFAYQEKEKQEKQKIQSLQCFQEVQALAKKSFKKAKDSFKEKQEFLQDEERKKLEKFFQDQEEKKRFQNIQKYEDAFYIAIHDKDITSAEKSLKKLKSFTDSIHGHQKLMNSLKEEVEKEEKEYFLSVFQTALDEGRTTFARNFLQKSHISEEDKDIYRAQLQKRKDDLQEEKRLEKVGNLFQELQSFLEKKDFRLAKKSLTKLKRFANNAEYSQAEKSFQKSLEDDKKELELNLHQVISQYIQEGSLLKAEENLKDYKKIASRADYLQLKEMLGEKRLSKSSSNQTLKLDDFKKKSEVYNLFCEAQNAIKNKKEADIKKIIKQIEHIGDKNLAQYLKKTSSFLKNQNDIFLLECQQNTFEDLLYTASDDSLTQAKQLLLNMKKEFSDYDFSLYEERINNAFLQNQFYQLLKDEKFDQVRKFLSSYVHTSFLKESMLLELFEAESKCEQKRLQNKKEDLQKHIDILRKKKDFDRAIALSEELISLEKKEDFIHAKKDIEKEKLSYELAQKKELFKKIEENLKNRDTSLLKEYENILNSEQKEYFDKLQKYYEEQEKRALEERQKKDTEKIQQQEAQELIHSIEQCLQESQFTKARNKIHDLSLFSAYSDKAQDLLSQCLEKENLQAEKEAEKQLCNILSKSLEEKDFQRFWENISSYQNHLNPNTFSQYLKDFHSSLEEEFAFLLEQGDIKRAQTLLALYKNANGENSENLQEIFKEKEQDLFKEHKLIGAEAAVKKYAILHYYDLWKTELDQGKKEDILESMKSIGEDEILNKLLQARGKSQQSQVQSALHATKLSEYEKLFEDLYFRCTDFSLLESLVQHYVSLFKKEQEEEFDKNGNLLSQKVQSFLKDKNFHEAYLCFHYEQLSKIRPFLAEFLIEKIIRSSKAQAGLIKQEKEEKLHAFLKNKQWEEAREFIQTLSPLENISFYSKILDLEKSEYLEKIQDQWKRSTQEIHSLLEQKRYKEAYKNFEIAAQDTPFELFEKERLSLAQSIFHAFEQEIQMLQISSQDALKQERFKDAKESLQELEDIRIFYGEKRNLFEKNEQYFQKVLNSLKGLLRDHLFEKAKSTLSALGNTLENPYKQYLSYYIEKAISDNRKQDLQKEERCFQECLEKKDFTSAQKYLQAISEQDSELASALEQEFLRQEFYQVQEGRHTFEAKKQTLLSFIKQGDVKSVDNELKELPAGSLMSVQLFYFAQQEKEKMLKKEVLKRTQNFLVLLKEEKETKLYESLQVLEQKIFDILKFFGDSEYTKVLKTIYTTLFQKEKLRFQKDSLKLLENNDIMSVEESLKKVKVKRLRSFLQSLLSKYIWDSMQEQFTLSLKKGDIKGARSALLNIKEILERNEYEKMLKNLFQKEAEKYEEDRKSYADQEKKFLFDCIENEDIERAKRCLEKLRRLTLVTEWGDIEKQYINKLIEKKFFEEAENYLAHN